MRLKCEGAYEMPGAKDWILMQSTKVVHLKQSKVDFAKHGEDESAFIFAIVWQRKRARSFAAYLIGNPSCCRILSRIPGLR
jgi:hypothetical protein